ncbi:MAG TPA: lysine biosynthesis protein LysW [Anaerolineaceae bacterium]|nr:lysine biosynthesis protein LysW [Anaerolineaceae bacterium]
MKTAACPDCGSEVNVGSQPRVGKQVVCDSCGAELEVVWLDPIELDYPMMDFDDYEEISDDER